MWTAQRSWRGWRMRSGGSDELDELLFEVATCGNDAVKVIGPNDHHALVALFRVLEALERVVR